MAFLKWEDYLVIALSIATSLGIGLYQSLGSKKMKTTSQYIMGDGKMATLPVAISLLVSFQSGISMLGVPAEVYLYGMQIYIGIIGEFITDVFCMYVFVPRLKKLNPTSIYEYLEVRYGSQGIRLFGTIMTILYEINYMGTLLLMPAVTLKAVAGINMWTSVIGMMVVVLIYTIIGGFKAVIWSDVIQAILMFGGLIGVLIKGTLETGGLAATWQIVYETGRVNLFVMYFTTAILCLFYPVLITAGGAVIFAYYHTKGCDPLISKELDNSNQLMPYMVTAIFQDTPCLPGLYLAALFCASLSTLSSLLSSTSAIFWEDIVKPHTKPMTDRRGVHINQFAGFNGLIFGIISVVVTFLISKLDGPVIQIFDTTSSCFGGAITGIFILGWCIPRANKMGAVVGGATSVLLVGWISFGKLFLSRVRSSKLEPAPITNCLVNNITTTAFTNTDLSSDLYGRNVTISPTDITYERYGLDALYSLSYRWLSPLGIITAVLVGTVVSRFKGENTVAPDLVVPVCDSLTGCLQNAISGRLHCNKMYHNPAPENHNETEISLDDLNQIQAL